METLEEAILWLEPAIDLLHECLGIGHFAEVAVTSDGYFLGRARGDCGFNYFLGKPSERALARSCDVFHRLSEPHRHELIEKLRLRGIPPCSVGIPEPED